MQECRGQGQLTLVEKTLECYNGLVLKDGSSKIELDLLEGQQAFRQLMGCIQGLIRSLRVLHSKRLFRLTYSNAYRVLYQDDSLGYIPQIFDSAQEGFPFIYVNGERYDFSMEVITLGEQLVDSYYKMIHQLRVASLRGEEWVGPVRTALQDFDQAWINYEQKYIRELISIEIHSKNTIKGIITAEEALTLHEQSQRSSGKIFLSGTTYDSLRSQLCDCIAHLNSIANVDGKGRDDLRFTILQAADNALATVTNLQSKSVRLLAERIRQSFFNLRQVLRFFGENLQMVDPQLRNNPELVMALQQYETSWEKGKRYLVEHKKQSQVVALSTIIDAAVEKHPMFGQLMEDADPSIFWLIPSIVVLRSLEGEDQGLVEVFMTSQAQVVDLEQLTAHYNRQKGRVGSGPCGLYNRLEQLILSGQEGDGEECVLLRRVKQMGVSLQRTSPVDWNDMLGVLLADNS